MSCYDYKQTSKIKIAGLLDELSENFFPFDCRFMNLTRKGWKQQCMSFNPDIVFIESIWNGYKKEWRQALVWNLSLDYIELIDWCRAENVPTVFWNKEDPIHIYTFLKAASLCDYVLTTDMDCVPLYKRLLKHERIYCMPFASSVKMFHPIEKYERKKGACFAGSYYNKREERKLDFENIANTLLEGPGLEIYDRNPYPNDPEYTFPEKYASHIVGKALPVTEIDVAYKGYEIGITLNIVKHSSTMEARRVFELLSSNTLTVSNKCLGLKTLLGDLIVHYETQEQFEEELYALLKNELYAKKVKLCALRKILSEHTYQERVAFLCKLTHNIVFHEQKISVYSIVESMDDILKVSRSYVRQSYNSKKLYLFSENSELIDNHTVFSLLDINEILKGSAAYYSYFNSNHYYGKNYLLDLLNSNKYEMASVIGKGSYYSAKSGAPIQECADYEYKLITKMYYDRAIVEAALKERLGFHADDGESEIEDIACLSIDSFNFCAFYNEDSCKTVDDIEIDTGISMEDIWDISHYLSGDSGLYDIKSCFQSEQIEEIFELSDKIITSYTPNGYISFLSTENITVTTKDFYTISDYVKDNLYFLYFDALKMGDGKLQCTMYNDQKEPVCTYGLVNQGIVTVYPDKLDNVVYFKLVLVLKKDDPVAFREICITPTPIQSLDLFKIRKEMQNEY